MKYIITTILLLFISSVASAHSVWLEKDGNNSANIYFGYWHKDLREKAEKLKRFESAKVFLLDEKKAVPLTLGENYLQASINTEGDVRMSQSLPAKERKRTGKFSKTYIYAKAGREETTSVMNFEMVPVTAGSNQFVVLFNGKPLEKAKITIFGPPKWQQNLRSDEDGKVTINTPWAGTYLIKARHKIKPENGKSTLENPILSHSFTLVIEVKNGIKWQIK